MCLPANGSEGDIGAGSEESAPFFCAQKQLQQSSRSCFFYCITPILATDGWQPFAKQRDGFSGGTFKRNEVKLVGACVR